MTHLMLAEFEASFLSKGGIAGMTDVTSVPLLQDAAVDARFQEALPGVSCHKHRCVI